MLKTACWNDQSCSELVLTHYSGHRDYLLPGNHPAVGFSRGLRRMHEKQQSVQGWPKVAQCHPPSPKAVLRLASDFDLAPEWGLPTNEAAAHPWEERKVINSQRLTPHLKHLTRPQRQEYKFLSSGKRLKLSTFPPSHSSLNSKVCCLSAKMLVFNIKYTIQDSKWWGWGRM